MYVRRSLIIIAVLVAALPFAVFSLRNRPQNTAQSTPLNALQLYEVQSGDVALTVNAIGAIEPNRQVALSFVVPGEVHDLFVQRDQYVEAGDPLIILSGDTQRLAYQQALLNLERAELDFRDLLIIDEDAIRIAELTVRSAIGAYSSIANAVTQEDLDAADLAYQQALDRIDGLERDRNRIGGIFGGESFQYREAEARVGEATFNAEIARLQAEELRTGTLAQQYAAWARVLQAEAELARVQAGPSQLQIDVSQISIDQAENQLADTESDFANVTLTAPFAGVITALNVELGGVVAPGLEVVELTDTSPLQLTVQVDEIDIGLVETGMGVRVTVDGIPGLVIPAFVSSIAPIGTPSGGIVSYDVGVMMQGEDPRVRVGMTTEATIIVEQTEDVLVVPNLYIRRDRREDRAFVNVLRDDNILEEVEVTLGIQGRESSEIVSGLEVGDLVALDLSGAGFNFLGGGE